jgi:hypothetical protein
MDTLINILLGVVGSLLAAEVWANAPRLGRWFIKHAVRQLPPSKRDQYHEEWLSHLDECPGGIDKLRHALGCYFRACRELAAREGLTPAKEQAVIKFTVKILARIMTLNAVPLIMRGKLNNLRLIWKVTEFTLYGAYMVKTRFGGTDADVKAITERLGAALRIHADKPPAELAVAACKDFAEAVLEIKRRHAASINHARPT